MSVDLLPWRKEVVRDLQFLCICGGMGNLSTAVATALNPSWFFRQLSMPYNLLHLYISQITCHIGYKNEEAASDTRQNSMSFSEASSSSTTLQCSVNRKITFELLVCVGYNHPRSAKECGRRSGSDFR